MAATNLDNKMRAGFGYRRHDLPGNFNPLAQGEERYESVLLNDGYDPELRRYRTGYLANSGYSDLSTNTVYIYGGAQYFLAPQKTLTIEHFTAAQESWIRYEMQFILSKKCSDAYEAERLHSPSSIISDRGVVIAHAEDLRNRSAADLGLHPQTYRDAQRKANLGQAATGFGADGRLHIFLNNKAFLGPSVAKGYFSLAEVLKHEFIHEGLSSWPDPTPIIGSLRHDLAGFPGYDRIMEGCR